MKLSFRVEEGHLGSFFAASWGTLGAFWGPLGGLLGPLGGPLGAPWGLFWGFWNEILI